MGSHKVWWTEGHPSTTQSYLEAGYHPLQQVCLYSLCLLSSLSYPFPKWHEPEMAWFLPFLIQYYLILLQRGWKLRGCLATKCPCASWWFHSLDASSNLWKFLYYQCRILSIRWTRMWDEIWQLGFWCFKGWQITFLYLMILLTMSRMWMNVIFIDITISLFLTITSPQIENVKYVITAGSRLRKG